MIESELRLFLSVDISGSTNLKNIKNYQKLIKRFNEIENLISKLKENRFVDKKNEIDDFKYKILCEEDLDWASSINSIFNDFHLLFAKNINETIYPWKVLGDELIYSFRIDSRENLYKYTLDFLIALRYYDKKLSKENTIRLKGSGWVAGFPVRNRKIIMQSFPELYYKNKKGNYEKFPYPREDYLGPDMDIGFRISKYVWPGFIVASLDLVYLLIQLKKEEKDQFKIYEVGWEQLKGVWNDRPYPIYWLSLPEEFSSNYYSYQEYYPWDIENNKFLKNYILLKENEKKKSQEDFLKN